MSRELGAFVGGKLITTKSGIVKTNKLEHLTDMVIISLDELDNSDNLEDGRLGNVLLGYHVTDSDEFMNFESAMPQYKRHKNKEFSSINLRLMDQNENVITDGPGMTIVLDIHD